jgi:hypothetical protein
MLTQSSLSLKMRYCSSSHMFSASQVLLCQSLCCSCSSDCKLEYFTKHSSWNA